LRLPPPPDEYSSPPQYYGIKPKQSQVDGHVMVDFGSYYQYGDPDSQIGEIVVADDSAECTCEDCKGNAGLQALYRTKYDGMKGSKKEIWTEEQTMLCPPRVLGYVLKDKQWAQLDVESLVEIQDDKSDDAFANKLQLAGERGGKQTKDLLMALVKNHGIREVKRGSTGYQLNDIVEEKGKGLVILLYGLFISLSLF
jgi:hypothetical protein